jgi:hypothetical protein
MIATATALVHGDSESAKPIALLTVDIAHRLMSYYAIADFQGSASVLES